MLWNRNHSVRSWLAMALFSVSLVAGQISSLVQAQDKPAATATTGIDIEVWAINEGVSQEFDLEIDELLKLGGPWMFRLSLHGLLHDSDAKSKPSPPTQVQLMVRDGHAARLNMLNIAQDKDSSLHIDLATTLGRNAITVDYHMTRRTKQGEVKVSGKQPVRFGNLMVQTIRGKASDGEGPKEQDWLVFMHPRQRNPDGSDAIVTVDTEQETNLFGTSFFPRPGRFELQVTEGWSGQLLVNSMSWQGIALSGTTNVGVSKDVNASDNHVPLATFRAERPVLEVVHSDDGYVRLVARRSGVASVRCQIPGMDGKRATCDLQIVVAADTTEVDRAILKVLPDAAVKVTPIKDAAMLTGTVAREEDLALLLEIAGQFFPKTINRVHVAADSKTARQVSDSVATDRPQQPPAPLPVTATAARRDDAESPRGRLPRRDHAELKALHDDVRALREDVRRLSDLLEKRQAAKDVPQSIPRDRVEVPERDTRGKFEPALPPNVLLSFTAPWCSPCQKMQPLIEKVIREGGSIQTIEIDRDAALAKRFHITSIPCFIRLESGKEVDRVTGLTSEVVIRRLAKFANPVHAGLNKPISLDLDGVPLKEALKRVSKLADLNIALDNRGLEEEGLKPDAAVSISVSGVTARSALSLILSPLNLGFVEQGEVLLVTSRDRSEGEMVVAVYFVNDLFPFLSPQEKDSPRKTEHFLSRIGELVRATVSPDSWDTVGGKASLRHDEATLSLVVRQTNGAQAAIANLLGQIRRLKLATNEGDIDKANERAATPLEVRTYSVADLVVPTPSDANKSPKPGAMDWLKLIDLITTQCDPECWPARGGASLIQAYEKTLSLVIRARPETHEKIIAVLDALRREQDVQVSVQVRWIECDDESELKKAGLELNFDAATRSMKLDAKAAATFIAACGEQGELAPKLTLFNGQIGTIQTEWPSGVRLALHLRGVVSQDRKSVCLGAALNPDSLVNDLVRRSNTLSDGEFLLIDRTDESNRAKSERPPGRKLVLVQPRIIIQEEEEELLGVPEQ